MYSIEGYTSVPLDVSEMVVARGCGGGSGVKKSKNLIMLVGLPSSGKTRWAMK